MNTVKMINPTIQSLLDGKSGQHIFPFFWLKGESEETLIEYLHVIKQAHIDAVCLESRPHPDFCGEQWWKDLSVILEEASKLQMKVWILDDSHFPTGFCNGAIAREIEKGDFSHVRRSFAEKMLGKPDPDGVLRIDRKKLFSAGEGVKTFADEYFMKNTIPHDEDRLLDVIAEDSEMGSILSLRSLGLVPTLEDDSESVCISLSELPKGNWELHGLYVTANRGPHRDYMNMLDTESCSMLIKAVYEPHYEHFKEYFGSVIMGFFSDEPEIGNGHIYQMDKRFYEVEDHPWSQELEEKLKLFWGEKWTEKLYLLWKDLGDSTSQIRYEYMDLVTRQVQHCFSEQVGNWCRDHGVQYIGHMIEDNNQHSRCGSSLGHYFRGLAGQDMAGIDDIGGQVLPQGEDLDISTKWQPHRDGTFYHFCLGKLAASAAAIDPLKKGKAMCEIFGNYGWQEGVNLEKYLADHFMVRGINHFVPHAFSAAEFPDPDCPPHFYAHGHNPQYRHFGKLMEYMERICSLISNGTPATDTAILYHAEADWTSKEYQLCQEPARKLAEAQIDYHFIPSDVFDEKGFRINEVDKYFAIGNQQYRYLIIPQTEWITSRTYEVLLHLKKAGIPAWFLNRLPQGILGTNLRSEDGQMDFSCIPTGELVAQRRKASQTEIEITPKNPFIRVYSYDREEQYHLYYFVHEGTEVYQGKVQIQNLALYEKLYEYDAWNNRIVEIKDSETICQIDLAQNQITICIEPGKSLLLIGEGNNTANDEKKKIISERQKQELLVTEELIEVERGHAALTQTIQLSDFKRSLCTAIDYPSFSNCEEVTLPDYPEKEYPKFGGFVRYETTLEIKEEDLRKVEEGKRVLLEITGLQEGIEVFLNGFSLGIQIIPVYRYDLSHFIQPGTNQLIIEKATTIERTIPKEKVRGLLWKEPQNNLGLTGEVYILFPE